MRRFDYFDVCTPLDCSKPEPQVYLFTINGWYPDWEQYGAPARPAPVNNTIGEGSGRT